MFDHLPKYHMKILLGDFIEKCETENLSKSRIGKEVYFRTVVLMVSEQ